LYAHDFHLRTAKFAGRGDGKKRKAETVMANMPATTMPASSRTSG